MMVPFIDREIPVTRIWLYQPDIARDRPLAAVRLQQRRRQRAAGRPRHRVRHFGDGSTNFVGDAQLPLMPKERRELVTFALDTKTAIRRDDRGITRPRSARR